MYFLLQMGIFQQSLCDRLPEGIFFAPNLVFGGRGLVTHRAEDQMKDPSRCQGFCSLGVLYQARGVPRGMNVGMSVNLGRFKNR